MFITKANFEKAIRRAKAEGRKEAEREFVARDNERNIYDSMNRLENRVIGRMERIEREVREMCMNTEVSKCQ